VEVALKIDVDTHQGLGEGVPRLRRLLLKHGIAASFYIAMGPDHSGRAIMRMFRNPGFFAKMRRTNAVSMYGWRTVLSGTLLPSRPIARAFPETIRQLAQDGFEVGVHGFDHVRWQDHIDGLGQSGIVSQLERAFATYQAILGLPSNSFAAPGWRTNATALRVLDTMRLAYRSDTRGYYPYRCTLEGVVFDTPEIPTTLPTLDEVMGTPEVKQAGSLEKFYLERMREDALNVHTIHAETEGMGQLDAFDSLLGALKQRGARFVRLGDIAISLAPAKLPIRQIIRTTLPGRAGWISAQARETAA
jgi:peptidoglycan/xylan/chitin deacetylase (PgdA/CDA1 family)